LQHFADLDERGFAEILAGEELRFRCAGQITERPDSGIGYRVNEKLLEKFSVRSRVFSA